jgi:secreted PhoX family phosphatase
MGPLDRRTLLRRGAAVAGGLAAATSLQALTARGGGTDAASAASLRAPDGGGYGPLAPAGPELALPEGFTYVAFGRTGEPMSDGAPTPAAHDGMAAFAGPGATIRLVRNHELGPGTPFGPGAYDPAAGGGTTTLLFDPVTGTILDSRASLTGTIRNCAGGPTPWGSWLSCEETTVGPESGSGLTRPHGYVFEVPAVAVDLPEPRPLTAMGRFVHEAVAVDPGTGIVYATEDRPTAGLYRFLPTVPGDLAQGGRLQMLAVRKRLGYDTRTGQTVGATLPVWWANIDNPDPATAATNPLAVYKQGRTKGGATFARLEGAWFAGGRLYVNATSGGNAGLGQVWEYRPTSTGGELRLVFESPGSHLLDKPDNITVAPSGALLLCEDGGGFDFLRGITLDGLVFDFGKNILNDSEFDGATFSPDGQVLFVNMQRPGITFAITGPWERGVL